ncbi:hypothetical protein BIFLAC_05782 [Bifidobacterium animalis subsp. lactis HN019]|nr:hypothetical protein BIFLAC_05782 [Bifidobacterium animalis subsp. lactis HN019]
MLFSEGAVEPVLGEEDPRLHGGFDAVDAAPRGLRGAERESVATCGVQMRLNRHVGRLACGDELQRVLHRHAIVGHRVPDEHRWRLRVDMLLDAHFIHRRLLAVPLAEERAEAAVVTETPRCDDRVGEHQRVRPQFVRIIAVRDERGIAGGSGEIRGQMTARGEADDGDARGVHVPFVCVRANLPHGFGHLEHGNGVDGRFAGIVEHKRVVVGGEELQRNRLALAACGHLITAAGQHKHGRTLAVGHDVGVVFGKIACKTRSGTVDADDGGLKILHDTSFVEREWAGKSPRLVCSTNIQ